jgi:hypothetical protein
MNLAEFFKKHRYITQAGVATRAGIDYKTLRLEIAGKYSSPQRLVLIEQAIHAMAKELLQVKIEQKNSEHD